MAIEHTLIGSHCRLMIKPDDDASCEVWLRVTFDDPYQAMLYRDKLSHHISRGDPISLQFGLGDFTKQAGK